MKPLEKNLVNLQRAFQAYVYDQDLNVTPEIISTEKLDSVKRLNIYADAYRSRLLEVLGDNYPALQAWVGEEPFNALGEDYIHTHPSDYFNIRWYGDQLPHFLKTQPPYAQHGELQELACFEWAMTLAFDAPDSEVITEAALMTVSPEEWGKMIFSFHPSLNEVSLYSNAPAIRTAVDKALGLPELQINFVPTSWILWRRACATYFRSLAADEEVALKRAQQGENFAAICALLLNYTEDETQAALRAAQLLKQWISEGLISGYQYLKNI